MTLGQILVHKHLRLGDYVEKSWLFDRTMAVEYLCSIV